MLRFSNLWGMCAVLLVLAACSQGQSRVNCNSINVAQSEWSTTELHTICSLWLGQLPPLPPDPSNAYGDDVDAAQLGQTLFFDTNLSANGEVACSTCHIPELAFTDGLEVAQGVDTGTRNSMTIVGTAYSPWFFWDGHKDSQWSQALEPLISPAEHGLTQDEVVAYISTEYASEYERVFNQPPALDDETFTNIGKAIAAYERTQMFEPSRFDAYANTLLNGGDTADILTEQELQGLRLFIGEANCTQCHNGPLFTNFEFHNTAVSDAPVDGRFGGTELVLADPFNCLGLFSDAEPEDCAELRFIKTDGTLLGAFKTPTLRDIALTAPYMHAGQFATLEEVINHYNTAPDIVRSPAYGHNELLPINLTESDQEALVAFLLTLTGGEDTP